MCLIALALNTHPVWPLVVLANRDEFHDRPASASAWWATPGGLSVLGGRDLKAGGSWMACRADGTLAALTNIREPGAPPGLRSRGELVMAALQAGQLSDLDTSPYASFNVLLARPHAGAWQVDYANSRGALQTLHDGVHGLSNGHLNDPWPKTEQLKARLGALLERMPLDGMNDGAMGVDGNDRDNGDDGNTGDDGMNGLDNPDRMTAVHGQTVDSGAMQAARRLSDAAFVALADRQTWPDDQLPKTGVPPEWERMLSACQIVSPAYGTRCSTVVCVHASGQMLWEERTLNPDGQLISTQRWGLRVGA